MPKRGMRLWLALLLLCLLAVAVSLRWYLPPDPRAVGQAAALGNGGRESDASARTTNPLVPVVVATAERRDVPEYLFGVGTVQAFKTVTVRSRVDGELLRLRFKDGQQVRAGDVLAELDTQLLQANVHAMEATIQRDQAQLQGAEAELGRLTALGVRDFASRSSIDNQRAQVAQFKAAIAADTARLDSAKIQLDYATVRSPIDGRAGLQLVDEGNLIHASDATGIVIVTQMQPIAIVFALPEDDLPGVQRRIGEGVPPRVTAFGRDGQAVLAEGSLLTIDNMIDRKSGTFKLKARFENEKSALWPGQFVNVRLRIGTREGGIVVPETALQRGPDGDFVYIVEPNNTVTMRPIKAAGAQDGAVLVDSGLRAGERVVIDGQFRLQPGSSVTEVPPEGTAEPSQPLIGVQPQTKS